MFIVVADADGQPTYRGVVWDQPLERVVGVNDLHRMSRAGINDVRTGVVGDTVLFAMADSLGITFFQDLPLAYLSAEVYRDSASAFLDQSLDSLISRAERYASARTLGLAMKSDTSVEEVCTTVDAVAARLNEATSVTISTYYVTDFFENDRCVGGRSLTVYGRSPSMQHFRLSPPVRVIGLTVGHRVVHGRHGGWRHLFSEEQQARRLENSLNHVFGMTNIAAVFVERWSDEPARASHDGDALRRQFGIIGPGGIPGRSFEVVDGIYTSKQTVFAIDAGSRREITGMWIIIVGWILVGSVSVAYMSSPQMRQMAPRYFMSHGFFRESVAEGRDAIPVASLVMLFAIAGSAGIIGTVIVSHFAETRAAQAFVYGLPDSLQNAVPLFMTRTFLLWVLISSLYALFMTSWTSLLSFWSRFGSTLLLPWQTLLLVVWPRWPILLVMFGALSVGAVNPSNSQVFLICAITLVTALLSIYRTINDYRLTAGMSWTRMLLPLMLNPTLIILLVLIIIALANADRAAFMAHLIRFE